jgi:hypothetical protein
MAAANACVKTVVRKIKENSHYRPLKPERVVNSGVYGKLMGVCRKQPLSTIETGKGGKQWRLW